MPIARNGNPSSWGYFLQRTKNFSGESVSANARNGNIRRHEVKEENDNKENWKYSSILDKFSHIQKVDYTKFLNITFLKTGF